jgi:hypothetical protein
VRRNKSAAEFLADLSKKGGRSTFFWSLVFFLSINRLDFCSNVVFLLPWCPYFFYQFVAKSFVNDNNVNFFENIVRVADFFFGWSGRKHLQQVGNTVPKLYFCMNHVFCFWVKYCEVCYIGIILLFTQFRKSRKFHGS